MEDQLIDSGISVLECVGHGGEAIAKPRPCALDSLRELGQALGYALPSPTVHDQRVAIAEQAEGGGEAITFERLAPEAFAGSKERKQLCCPNDVGRIRAG